MSPQLPEAILNEVDRRKALCRAVDERNRHSTRFGAEIDFTGTGLRRLQAPEVPEGLR